MLFPVSFWRYSKMILLVPFFFPDGVTEIAGKSWYTCQNTFSFPLTEHFVFVVAALVYFNMYPFLLPFSKVVRRCNFQIFYCTAFYQTVSIAAAFFLKSDFSLIGSHLKSFVTFRAFLISKARRCFFTQFLWGFLSLLYFFSPLLISILMFVRLFYFCLLCSVLFWSFPLVLPYEFYN